MSATAAPVAGVVMGSDSDWPVMEPAAAALTEFGVPYEAHVLSAHRTPHRMLDYAGTAAGIFRGCCETAQEDLLFGEGSAGITTGLCLHAFRHSKAQK